MITDYDTIIIGGGFYGLRIAQFLREEIGQAHILIIEKMPDVMMRASYNNQARVHGGYHYPRSVLTAIRSKVNLPIFSEEYSYAVDKRYTNYYSVANNFSKVTSKQFERFYERIGAEMTTSEDGKSYFNPKLIDEVFQVKEYVFNAAKLKHQLIDKLKVLEVRIHKNEEVSRIAKTTIGIKVITDKATYTAKSVINSTYSSINNVNKNSGLPIIPFKHELTEMCLVNVPDSLKGKGYTVMCGPFFSLMPFPDRGMYTLSHVRYTPHSEWQDSTNQVRNSHSYLNEINKISHFPQMKADIVRYMPAAEGIEYSGESLWEIKTVLPQSEGDDSRPILYKDNFGGINNYICIMGGKIDNIYDVFRELRKSYDKET